jgi:hypothetical protein
MPWPVHPTGFFGARGDSDTYRIERSLRFNSADSAYLSRTPSSAGNRKTWTFSCWVKRSGLTSSGFILGNTSSSATNGLYLHFSSTDTLRIGDYATSGFDWLLESSQVFRDVSAWYHIVAVFNSTNATTANRVRLYINGSEITSFSSSSYPSLNADGRFNDTAAIGIGRTGLYNGEYFSGYLTEINFIDGQALTPSSFGETDSITGRWKAKSYGGTYGTNGFYLKFADNSGTTDTTLGKDSSGNGNNWTPNNFSVTAGAGNDSLVDSPTNYGTDTGLGGEVRGNYCTINTLDTNSNITISDGNLNVVGSGAWRSGYANIPIGSSSKVYFEVHSLSTNAGTYAGIGVTATPNKLTEDASGSTIFYGYLNSALKNIIGTLTSFGTNWSSTDILGFAVDRPAKTMTVYLNGVSQGSITSSLPENVDLFVFFSVYTYTLNFNFGQRPFAYTAPSGFKALCTQNLPQPTIQKPSLDMDVVTYTGTGASQSISSLGFSPDLVWIKGRSGATDHTLYDVIRGSQARLESNTTDAEVTSDNGLTSFDSAGFTVGTLAQVNTNTSTYVAWSWDAGSANSTNNSGSITSTVRANLQAGFSIVSYTGNGSSATIGHGLGATPKMIIVKTRSTTGDWVVGHASLDPTSPWGYYIYISSTSARSSLGAINTWGNNSIIVAPTSTVFSVGNGANLNSSGITYIAYCFSEIEGYSKFGSYTGNGSSGGPFVWCGFRPRWVMIKCSSSASSMWHIIDTARSEFNLADDPLFPNSDQAENSGSSYYFYDILSNGIKIRTSDVDTNGSGRTYIFAAFAEAPFKYARAR